MRQMALVWCLALSMLCGLGGLAEAGGPAANTGFDGFAYSATVGGPLSPGVTAGLGIGAVIIGAGVGVNAVINDNFSGAGTVEAVGIGLAVIGVAIGVTPVAVVGAGLAVGVLVGVVGASVVKGIAQGLSSN